MLYLVILLRATFANSLISAARLRRRGVKLTRQLSKNRRRRACKSATHASHTCTLEARRHLANRASHYAVSCSTAAHELVARARFHPSKRPTGARDNVAHEASVALCFDAITQQQRLSLVFVCTDGLAQRASLFVALRLSGSTADKMKLIHVVVFAAGAHPCCARGQRAVPTRLIQAAEFKSLCVCVCAISALATHKQTELACLELECTRVHLS